MKLKEFILNFFLASSLFCASFYLAWQVSASSNFLYSTWYEFLEIDSVISTYSPKNKNNKNGFEELTKTEHVKLFAEIVSAIQKGGVGLENIAYKSSANNKNEKLLTKAEVIHLQDVANLISVIKKIGLIGLFLFLCLLGYMIYAKQSIGKLKNIFLTACILIVIVILGVLIAGPTKIFYLGHELVFPDNHQWFFYYEESLMSTMMKAPALFGPIACQLLVLTLLIWLLVLYTLQKINRNPKTA